MTEIMEENKINNLQTSENNLQYLTFTVGKEEYGVEIMNVREIKAWSEATRLPNTPKFMLGVMNLRGSVIPIFDLRARFTGEMTSVNQKNVVIIVALEERTIGILVDAVSDIVSANSAEIMPPPSADLGVDERYVEGLISMDERMVVLLNVNLLFDKESLKQASETQEIET